MSTSSRKKEGLVIDLFLPFFRKKITFPEAVPWLPLTPINRTAPIPIPVQIPGKLGMWVGKHLRALPAFTVKGASKEGVGNRHWVSKSAASVTPAKQRTLKSGQVNHFSRRKASKFRLELKLCKGSRHLGVCFKYGGSFWVISSVQICENLAHLRRWVIEKSDFFS